MPKSLYFPTTLGRSVAKHKNNRNFVAIPITAAVPLSTLANDTVVKGSLIGTLLEDLFIFMTDLSWTLRDITIGETPVEVGLSHSDYTVAEILETLNVNFLGPGEKIEQERARRLVRSVGAFIGTQASDGGISLNDGRKIRTKLRWVANSGKDLSVWARNVSGGTLTTGAILQCHGFIYGRWMI